MQFRQKKFDNATCLAGIKAGDSAVLEAIIAAFQPGVTAYVRSMGGSEADAEDIFATALEALYGKLQKEELILTDSFEAYLFTICKFQWLKLFRQKKRMRGVTNAQEQLPDDEASRPDRALERRLLHAYVRAAFQHLSADCRRIIQMRWDGHSYADICTALGYGSEGYARKRKHVCRERLIKLVKQDARIRELYGQPENKGL